MTTTNADMLKTYTGKAGDINRQLALAGVALIWLLHSNAGKLEAAISLALSAKLRCALYFMIVSLGVDLAQYILGSALWAGAFGADADGAAKDNKPAIWIPVGLIAVKIILMVIAYGYLVSYLRSMPFLGG